MANKRFKLPTERLGELQRHVEQKANDSSYLNTEGVVEVPIELLDSAPWNARRHFDETALKRLTDDIQSHGLIHPITVRPKDSRFEVVVGERRYRATKLIGLSSIKAHVRPLDDATAHQIALLENLNREDLNPYEETIGYLQLLALKLNELPYFQEPEAGDPPSQEAVLKVLNRLWNEKKRAAYRGTNNVISPQIVGSDIERTILDVFQDIGKMTWESFFQNRLPLLRLPQDILTTLYDGAIPYTKARLLAKVDDENTRKSLLKETIDQGLPITRLRKIVKAHQSQEEDEQIIEQFSTLARKIRKNEILRNKQKRHKIEQLLREIEGICK